MSRLVYHSLAIYSVVRLDILKFPDRRCIFFGASPAKREHLLEFVVDYFANFRKILGNCLTHPREKVLESRGGGVSSFAVRVRRVCRGG